MSSSPSDSRLIAALNDLLQLDHDAVEAYTVAIDLVRREKYRDQLVAYRADHKRHIEELAALVRQRGGLPTEVPHATAPLKLAVQALGAAPGDPTLLLAFKAVEGQARDKYRRFAAREWPADVAEVIARGAADEDTHYRWVEQALTELGVGAGTLPHGIAAAVEGLHKLLADPIEGFERRVKEQVGELFGARGKHGGSSAPSPADILQGMADMAMGGMHRKSSKGGARRPASGGAGASAAAGGGDAAPEAAAFIAALRALEESGDVEAMVALHADDAEVSGPTDEQPHQGREGARRFWRMYRDSFEQVHSRFTNIVAAPDGTVVLEWTSDGRVTTGGSIAYSGVSVVQMRDGLVRRFRTYFDTRELEQPPRPRTDASPTGRGPDTSRQASPPDVGL